MRGGRRAAEPASVAGSAALAILQTIAVTGGEPSLRPARTENSTFEAATVAVLNWRCPAHANELPSVVVSCQDHGSN